MNDLDLCLVVV